MALIQREILIDPDISVYQISKRLGLNYTQVDRALTALHEAGIYNYKRDKVNAIFYKAIEAKKDSGGEL